MLTLDQLGVDSNLRVVADSNVCMRCHGVVVGVGQGDLICAQALPACRGTADTGDQGPRFSQPGWQSVSRRLCVLRHALIETLQVASSLASPSSMN
jgi:hypothetical protein